MCGRVTSVLRRDEMLFVTRRVNEIMAARLVEARQASKDNLVAEAAHVLATATTRKKERKKSFARSNIL